MKKIIKTVAILLLVLFFAACNKQSDYCKPAASLPPKLDTLQLEGAVKGWELYSWLEEEKHCRHWKYALLQGTNRLKSYNAITKEAVLRVSGEEQLKLLLDKLPAGENILWPGRTWLSNTWGPGNIDYGDLELPPAAFTSAIKAYCLQRGLSLTLAP